LKLSVIILNYNVQYFLEQCLQSVQKAISTIDAEIIVIDNDSKDGSCDLIRNKFSEVILIENNENVGFSKANNQGVAIAKGEYVCILNPDTIVAENTFVNALSVIEVKNEIGALGVKLIDGTGNFLPESKRNVPTIKSAAAKLINSSKKTYYANHLNENENGYIDILVGAFMFIEKKKYKEVGGFDEDYFMYGEDIDLSYKFLKAGYKNYYLGSAKTLHYKGESTSKDKEYFKRFYGAMHIFYSKHFPKKIGYKFLLKLSITGIKWINAFKSKKKKQPFVATQKIFLLSENINLLRQLSEIIKQPINSISKSICKDGGISDAQLIFDANYISFTDILEIIQLLKNQRNTFRIRPTNCNFIIGSDQSDEKGEVVIF